MRKDRVTGISICLILLCSLHVQRMLGIRGFAAPSLPQMLWGMASGEMLSADADPGLNPKAQISVWRSNPALALVFADPRPLGFISMEWRVLNVRWRRGAASKKGIWKYLYRVMLGIHPAAGLNPDIKSRAGTHIAMYNMRLGNSLCYPTSRIFPDQVGLHKTYLCFFA